MEPKSDIQSMFDTQVSSTISNDQVKLEESVAEKVETQTQPNPEETSTQQPPETKPEGETKQESFFDRFTIKPEAEKKSEETKQSVEETQVKMPEDYEQVKKELEDFKNHPVIKMVMGDKDLSSIDLKSFFKDAIGEDLSTLSDEQLIEKSLKANPAFGKLSKEEAEQEIDKAKSELEGMTKLEKLTKRDQMINQLSKDIPQSELLKKLTEIQDNQKKSVNPDEYATQKLQETFDTTFKDINTHFEETGKSLIGQSYKGYVATKEDVDAVVTAFHKNSHEFDKDRVFFEYFLAVTADKRAEDAEKRGYERGLKEQANPSRNDSGSPVIVTQENAGGMKNATKEEFFAQANN